MAKNILLCILALAALTACGIKPKSLKPPADSSTVYPRSYPAPDAEMPVNQQN